MGILRNIARKRCQKKREKGTNKFKLKILLHQSISLHALFPSIFSLFLQMLPFLVMTYDLPFLFSFTYHSPSSHACLSTIRAIHPIISLCFPPTVLYLPQVALKAQERLYAVSYPYTKKPRLNRDRLNNNQKSFHFAWSIVLIVREHS
jgi:hypothetical protein